MFESFLGINFLNLYDTDAFLAIQLILTLTINCAIFKRMTDIRISWTAVSYTHLTLPTKA